MINIGDFINGDNFRARLVSLDLGLNESIWSFHSKTEKSDFVGWIHNKTTDKKYIFSFYHPQSNRPSTILWDFSLEFVKDLANVLNYLNNWDMNNVEEKTEAIEPTDK